MRTSGLISLLALAVTAGACSGDIDGVVTTDFGDAVATSQRSDTGDISSWLTAQEGDQMIGQLHWDAAGLSIDATLAEQPLPFSGDADLGGAELIDVNLFLYALWEVERDAPEGTVCVENTVAICCHGDAWSCATRVE
jgi:hypothetical protein